MKEKADKLNLLERENGKDVQDKLPGYPDYPKGADVSKTLNLKLNI